METTSIFAGRTLEQIKDQFKSVADVEKRAAQDCAKGKSLAESYALSLMGALALAERSGNLSPLKKYLDGMRGNPAIKLADVRRWLTLACSPKGNPFDVASEDEGNVLEANLGKVIDQSAIQILRPKSEYWVKKAKRFSNKDHKAYVEDAEKRKVAVQNYMSENVDTYVVQQSKHAKSRKGHVLAEILGEYLDWEWMIENPYYSLGKKASVKKAPTKAAIKKKIEKQIKEIEENSAAIGLSRVDMLELTAALRVSVMLLDDDRAGARIQARDIWKEGAPFQTEKAQESAMSLLS